MKELLTFIENLPSTTIKIKNHPYQVSMDGTGNIPMISLGVGSHMQMTLSPQLKKLVKIYSSDLYWIASERLAHPNQLIMNDLIDDSISMISQLNLKKPLLIGFSCYGILALEVAKKLNSEISGVVLVSTPPKWNDDVISFAQSYFNKHASPERKLNDTQRKEHFSKIRKPNESIVSVNAYEADAARYWKNFNISREFLDLLWHGINADDEMMNHFFGTLLPAHDLKKDLEKITVPVIHLAGQCDFDSVPLILWESFPKPKNFTVIDCGETGHWPNLENPVFFDTALKQWLTQNI